MEDIPTVTFAKTGIKVSVVAQGGARTDLIPQSAINLKTAVGKGSSTYGAFHDLATQPRSTPSDGNRGIPRYSAFAELLVKPRLVADPLIAIGGHAGLESGGTG